MKDLAVWIRNNWRPYSSGLESKPSLQVNILTVVWEIHREEVEEELKAILDVDTLNAQDPRYFQQRNAAAKQTLEKLTVKQRARIDAIVAERKTKGNPEPVQRECVS